MAVNRPTMKTKLLILVLMAAFLPIVARAYDAVVANPLTTTKDVPTLTAWIAAHGGGGGSSYLTAVTNNQVIWKFQADGTFTATNLITHAYSTYGTNGHFTMVDQYANKFERKTNAFTVQIAVGGSTSTLLFSNGQMFVDGQLMVTNGTTNATLGGTLNGLTTSGGNVASGWQLTSAGLFGFDVAGSVLIESASFLNGTVHRPDTLAGWWDGGSVSVLTNYSFYGVFYGDAGRLTNTPNLKSLTGTNFAVTYTGNSSGGTNAELMLTNTPAATISGTMPLGALPSAVVTNAGLPSKTSLGYVRAAIKRAITTNGPSVNIFMLGDSTTLGYHPTKTWTNDTLISPAAMMSKLSSYVNSDNFWGTYGATTDVNPRITNYGGYSATAYVNLFQNAAYWNNTTSTNPLAFQITQPANYGVVVYNKNTSGTNLFIARDDAYLTNFTTLGANAFFSDDCGVSVFTFPLCTNSAFKFWKTNATSAGYNVILGVFFGVTSNSVNVINCGQAGASSQILVGEQVGLYTNTSNYKRTAQLISALGTNNTFFIIADGINDNNGAVNTNYFGTNIFRITTNLLNSGSTVLLVDELPLNGNDPTWAPFRWQQYWVSTNLNVPRLDYYTWFGGPAASTSAGWRDTQHFYEAGNLEQAQILIDLLGVPVTPTVYNTNTPVYSGTHIGDGSGLYNLPTYTSTNAFLKVTLNSATVTATNGTDSPIIFDTVVTNAFIGYNSATGVITFTNAGAYDFALTIQEGSGAANNWRLHTIKGTTASGSQIDRFQSNNNGGNTSITWSGQIEAAAGESWLFSAWHNSGANVTINSGTAPCVTMLSVTKASR